MSHSSRCSKPSKVTRSPRRQSRTQRYNRKPVAVDERVKDDKKRVGAALQRLESGPDILRSRDSRCDEIESERTCGFLRLTNLAHDEGIAAVAHDSQSAEPRDDLPQKFDPLARKISRQE